MVIITLTMPLQSYAFCGFYVAGAGSDLFNESSEVILVRDGKKTTVTMKNDFEGDPEEFAMVVPVPTVISRKDIDVVDPIIFETLDKYSAPRLLEYFDHNPCEPYVDYITSIPMINGNMVLCCVESTTRRRKDKRVKIEAKYEVKEYDILVLSSKNSSDLKGWLEDNDYDLPPQAEEVLEPYIKNNMKFFVATVDKKRMKNPNELSPLQISYEHDNFMLPIRLGMANSKGEQDLIVYAFTKEGRIECTNYRTDEMPTANEIPPSVEPKFQKCYTRIYDKQYNDNGEKAVFLEYAWDVSPQNTMKCDPCIGPPPLLVDFTKAGVDWVSSDWSADRVYFTRLHVRYSRDKFLQDLSFQVTPNTENYQVRYVMRQPATGDFFVAKQVQNIP